jgi:hypothetical protein
VASRTRKWSSLYLGDSVESIHEPISCDPSSNESNDVAQHSNSGLNDNLKVKSSLYLTKHHTMKACLMLN